MGFITTRLKKGSTNQISPQIRISTRILCGEYGWLPGFSHGLFCRGIQDKNFVELKDNSVLDIF